MKTSMNGVWQAPTMTSRRSTFLAVGAAIALALTLSATPATADSAAGDWFAIVDVQPWPEVFICAGGTAIVETTSTLRFTSRTQGAYGVFCAGGAQTFSPGALWALSQPLVLSGSTWAACGGGPWYSPSNDFLSSWTVPVTSVSCGHGKWYQTSTYHEASIAGTWYANGPLPYLSGASYLS